MSRTTWGIGRLGAALGRTTAGDPETDRLDDLPHGVHATLRISAFGSLFHRRLSAPPCAPARTCNSLLWPLMSKF